MKTWKILNQKKLLKSEDLLAIILENRGLITKKDQQEFLHPFEPSQLTAKELEISPGDLTKSLKRISQAIKKQEQIVVYGDYDCDGITATAIMWQTLFNLGARVLPFIPDRAEEGYGLSLAGLDNLKEKIPETKLIITVDHGIVAVEQTEYAQKKLGLDVIITDHHTKAKKLPKAFAIIHTRKLSGSGLSWFVAKELLRHSGESREAERLQNRFWTSQNDVNLLDLPALGTIADMVPLVGANRSIAKYGLAEIQKTSRVGLLALIKEAGLIREKIGTYEVSFVLAPRLNALGRIDNALDALRLLCTKDEKKAQQLAMRLNEVNGERQRLTEETVFHARAQLTENSKQISNLIFISHETYNQGVIGLVAGKLVESFYRPAIVVSKGRVFSKASARSISGFNIVEAIRTQTDLLIDVGGHPMAAGFTIETEKLEILEQRLTEFAEKNISEELLKRQLIIDGKLDLENITSELFEKLEELKPFGMKNPEPLFCSEVEVVETRLVGATAKHLKLVVRGSSDQNYDAIAFNFGGLAGKINKGDKIQIAYTIAKDEWNGNNKLQLKVRDIKLSV
ncbi:single-stranded-DNA-specific exonuclease RecJ [Candidatus Gottesmanbacteria bacterium]|nr:single-stranded-DNA-specific exonuclease RecJ [Candidatus Gottesmanbacteria bacterium]